MNLDKSCRVLRDFKTNYLLLHEDRVRNDNLNRRRKEVLNREKPLEVILENFYDLPEESQIASSMKISFSIGSIDKFVNLSQNLLSAHLSPVITSEEDLNQTEFANMTGDSESDSDSKFKFISSYFFLLIYFWLFSSVNFFICPLYCLNKL